MSASELREAIEETDRAIAEGYAHGDTLIESRPDMRQPLQHLLEELVQ